MCIALMGCTHISNLSKQGNIQVISIPVDLTDEMIAFKSCKPSTLTNFISVTRPNGNPNDGCILRLTSITDVKLNEEQVISIEPTNSLSNQMERKLAIDSFSRQVDSCILNLQKVKSTISQSAVFEKMIHELQWLNSYPNATDKILIMYSDCRQHILNHPLNMYDPALLDMLNDRPEQFDNLFEASYKLPKSLSGISIYFIYQSKDITNDQIFSLVTDRLKILLEKRGARVFISGTLNL